MTVVDRLCHTTSPYMKRALDSVFAVTFYVSVKDIITRYSYEDRFKFFEYVFGTSASLISEAITTAIEESGEYTTVSVWLGERVNSVAYRENQNGLIIHSSNHNNAVYNCIY